MSRVRAKVIVLAGPSGAGKSRLADRTGLPVLRLDDFYKSAGDPTLPRIATGANTGLVDWDHPDSWLPDDAHDGRDGSQILDLGDHDLFVAEGIFAQDVVAPCREAGLLAAAYCVRQDPLVRENAAR